MDNSSYGDTMKFYERMSQLHVELKSYENEQHRLEEEYERIGPGSQVLTVPSAPLSSGLLMSSAIDNPNPNYSNSKEAENTRHLRNQTILSKIQELETNSSVFAARSERLRMMRSEYESLVRKWSLHRNRPSSGEWQGNKMSGWQASGDFISSSSDMNSNKRCELVTIGVNTDISGPVKAILPYDANGEEVIEREIEKTDSYLLEMAQNPNAGLRAALPENESFGKPINAKEINQDELNKNRIHPLLDISSTSESQSDFTARNIRTIPIFDNTFPDDTSETTSLSLVPRKEKAKRDLLQSLTDNSESTENFQVKNSSSNKYIERADTNKTFAPSNKSDTRSYVVAKAAHPVMPENASQMRPDFHNVADAKTDGKRNQEGQEGRSRSDSPTTTSIGDSLMDSVQNTKLPESLLTDGMNIGRDRDDENEQSQSNNSSRLINEDDNEEPQSQDDDLSLSKLAREEIEIGKDAKHQISNANVEQTSNYNNMNEEADERIDFHPSGNGVSLSSILVPSRKTEMWDVDDEKEKDESKHEVKAKETIDDSPSASVTKKEMAMFKASSTIAGSVTGPSIPKTASRRVRLKLDYEDSESDVSDITPIQPKSKATTDKNKGSDSTAKQPTKQKYDDDFDDFFDI